MADLARSAWLSLGSNLGDRAALIGEAARRLAAVPGMSGLRLSGLYRTPPWGDTDQGEFLNAAAAVATTLAPHALLAACLAIEDGLGRVRERRWGPRAIDIDIVAYEGVTSAEPRLTLPHPLWRERAFVVVPLHEIVPDLDIAGEGVAERLAALDLRGIERVP